MTRRPLFAAHTMVVWLFSDIFLYVPHAYVVKVHLVLKNPVQKLHLLRNGMIARKDWCSVNCVGFGCTIILNFAHKLIIAWVNFDHVLYSSSFWNQGHIVVLLLHWKPVPYSSQTLYSFCLTFLDYIILLSSYIYN